MERRKTTRSVALARPQRTLPNPNKVEPWSSGFDFKDEKGNPITEAEAIRRYEEDRDRRMYALAELLCNILQELRNNFC